MLELLPLDRQGMAVQSWKEEQNQIVFTPELDGQASLWANEKVQGVEGMQQVVFSGTGNPGMDFPLFQGVEGHVFEAGRREERGI